MSYSTPCPTFPIWRHQDKNTKYIAKAPRMSKRCPRNSKKRLLAPLRSHLALLDGPQAKANQNSTSALVLDQLSLLAPAKAIIRATLSIFFITPWAQRTWHMLLLICPIRRCWLASIPILAPAQRPTRVSSLIGICRV